MAKIKKANAKATVLYYWGFWGTGHKNYRVYADSGFKPAWYVQKAGQKKPHLDLSNPEFRAWWARRRASWPKTLGTRRHFHRRSS